MQIALLIAAALIILLQVRGILAMSTLSDKIAAAQASLTTLTGDVATAVDNAATPADLQALDQLKTDLDALIASLTPTA